MTPVEANADIDLPLSAEAGTSSRTRLLQRAWIRRTLIAGVGAGSLATMLLVTYELALARMPQHRAALERLVRAHTGLDVRFNELGFRWGWYGPEAVFKRVELAEPGNASVVVRAPQLTVGFDAWRTVRTGHLSPGRITLVAPDIDLERFTRGRQSAETSGTASAAAAPAQRVQVLEQWRGGRIDLQGGTLKLPGPSAASGPVTLHIRRASLRRSDDEWNGFGLVFLPERLGRTARLVVQLRGDLAQPRTLSGALRFEGTRVAFAGWREVFSEFPTLARNLPLAGGGDVMVHLTLQNGRVEKADGRVRATDISLGVPTWAEGAQPAYLSRAPLHLDYVSGEWRFARRPESGQLQIEQLALSREEKDAPLPRISVEIGSDHVRGELANAPLRSVAVMAQWLTAEPFPSDLDLQGTAKDIDFDWNAARPEGERLAASAHADDARVASRSLGVALGGLRTRLMASESRVTLEVHAPEARFDREAAPEAPLDGLKIAAVIELRRLDTGWSLTTPAINIAHTLGELTLSGSLSGDADGATPVLDASGTLEHVDVAKLQELFAAGLVRLFGPASMRVAAGRIEEGKFELKERLGDGGAAGAKVFKGSLRLHEARVAAGEPWPEAEAVEAVLSWNGPRIRVSVEAGHAGAFQLESVDAQWDVSGARSSRVSGQARARVENALAWVRENPQLQEQVPHLQDLVARGDALLSFDVKMPASAPAAPRAAPPRARVHLVTVLEGVQFLVAPELPPVESLRGSLAFDSGRLQRSTLSATWLGGPLTLKVAERADRGGTAMAVQAQGFIDATKLVALSQIKNLPEVSGETPWSGDFVYFSPTDKQPARWRGHADTALVGIASSLPAPFAKREDASVPLRAEITGTDEGSEVRVTLADRVKTAFALSLREGRDWRIERGVIRMGAGAASLPSEDVIAVQGHVKRLDLPAYLAVWQQLHKDAQSTPAVVDLLADEVSMGSRLVLNASVHASPMSGGTSLRIEAKSLGMLTGTLVSGTPNVVLNDLRLVKEALTGEGSIECSAGVATCKGRFELNSQDVAATLAGLGLRPELNAARGSLSGELTWQPRVEHPWLETATGKLSMRFEDGIARHLEGTDGRPFPLLTVPALLTGIARPPDAAGVPAGALRFKRLDAQFELRDGEAFTSDLHFDGEAEILVRGRTGLLTRDYDHEAWVLRGEERIPASLRRLGATPRVAAAWMSLRELLRGDSVDRSRLVLHLRGSWNEPVVTVE
jgi:uncharacterized protein YhdP